MSKYLLSEHSKKQHIASPYLVGQYRYNALSFTPHGYELWSIKIKMNVNTKINILSIAIPVTHQGRKDTTCTAAAVEVFGNIASEVQPSLGRFWI